MLPIPQDDVSDDIQKEWQDARANRIMQFKVGDFQDSNIRMLTGTLKADWIQLPVERYLAALSISKCRRKKRKQVDDGTATA